MAFQSTLPRGERPIAASNGAVGGGFNPRSRAGSDGKRNVRLYLLCRFNPRSRAGSD